MTEKEYAFKSIREVTASMNRRTEQFLDVHYTDMKELMGYYQKLIRENQLVLEELEMECQEKINEDLAYAMDYLNTCDYRLNVGRLRKEMGNLMMIYGLSDMLCRAMVLMKYYAPDGITLEQLIHMCYCSQMNRTDTDIQLELGFGRSKFYQKKKEALRYLGYFFYEIVLPQAKDARYKTMRGTEGFERQE